MPVFSLDSSLSGPVLSRHRISSRVREETLVLLVRVPFLGINEEEGILGVIVNDVSNGGERLRVYTHTHTKTLDT